MGGALSMSALQCGWSATSERVVVLFISGRDAAMNRQQAKTRKEDSYDSFAYFEKPGSVGDTHRRVA